MKWCCKEITVQSSQKFTVTLFTFHTLLKSGEFVIAGEVGHRLHPNNLICLLHKTDKLRHQQITKVRWQSEGQVVSIASQFRAFPRMVTSHLGLLSVAGESLPTKHARCCITDETVVKYKIMQRVKVKKAKKSYCCYWVDILWISPYVLPEKLLILPFKLVCKTVEWSQVLMTVRWRHSR